MEIDPERFKLLYKCWQDRTDVWSGVDAIAVVVPPRGAGQWNHSTALSLWLLGRHCWEALVVFTRRSMHFLGMGERLSPSLTLKDNKDMDIVVHVHIRDPAEDGGPHMLDILEAIRSEACSPLPKVAVLLQEPLVGNVMHRWDAVLRSSLIYLVDAAPGLQELFAVKSEGELVNVEKAAMVSMAAMKRLTRKVHRAVEEQRPATHTALMSRAQFAITHPQQKLKLEQLEEGTTEICNRPSVKSGGASDPNEPLCYDAGSVITCSLGARYKHYCSNVARTYFVDPSLFQERRYNMLHKAQEAAVKALMPGNPISEAYSAAASVIAQEGLDVVATDVGSGMGLQLKELGLVLNMHNDKVVKPGMVFNVQLTYQGLVSTRGDQTLSTLSIVLADTVIVRQEGPEIVTAQCPKDFKQVAFSLAEVLDECEPPPKRHRLFEARPEDG